jgi:hypothetical protein
MNTLEKDKRLGTSLPKDAPMRDALGELMKMAKPIGTFGGVTDFILRFRNGELVAANTGDQGGGQN